MSTGSPQPPNWKHKRKFLFRNKELAPIHDFHLGLCTGSDGNPLEQGPDAEYIPSYLSNGLRPDADQFRLAYSKFWVRNVISQAASYGYDASRMWDKLWSIDPLRHQVLQPQANLLTTAPIPGSGLYITNNGAINSAVSSERTDTLPFGHSLYLDPQTVLNELYNDFPWNTLTVVGLPADGFLAQHREKIIMQVAPPVSPLHYEGQARIDFQAKPTDVVPGWMQDPNVWKTFIAANFDKKSYTDCSFSMWTPFEEKDIDQLGYSYSQSVRDVWVKITPSYNFYIKSYEDTITEVDVSESLLPNLYVFASEFDNRFEDLNDSRFSKLINLVDDRGFPHIDKQFVDIKANGRKVGEEDFGQYFEKWSEKIEEVSDPNTVFSNLIEQYKHVALPMSNLSLLDAHKGDERLFPMHIKLDFVTDVQTQFADMLNEANLFPLLCTIVRKSATGDTIDGLYSFQYWDSVAQEMCEYLNEFVPTRVFDLGEWLNLIRDPLILQQQFSSVSQNIQQGTGSPIFFGRMTEELQALMNPANALFVILMMLRFQFELTDLVKPTTRPADTSISTGGKFRSFKEILQGKEAYSETLFYRIEKLDADTEESLQSVWLPNSSQVDTLSYIDTQVKYNKQYRYKIWAYQMVIGNRYDYQVSALAGNNVESSDGAIHPLGDFLARLCVFNTPDIKLIEVPYYDTKIDYPNGIAVVDMSPVRPDVNIIPYQNVGNKLLLWLNGNVGDYWEEPISILDTDDFAQMLRLHGRDPNNNGVPTEVHFKSDDHVTEFDIFRLSKRPRLYTDFSEGKHTRISAARGSTSGDYVDDVSPNKKYYYTFRALDNHGHLSNPSPVYECELVKDNENIYSLIRIIDMGVDLGRAPSKSGRRFIQIRPAFAQTLLNERELAGDVRSISSLQGVWTLTNEKGDQTVLPRLGPTTENLWGDASAQRKFKIRLSSTKSSKKMDINVRFKKVEDEMEE